MRYHVEFLDDLNTIVSMVSTIAEDPQIAFQLGVEKGWPRGAVMAQVIDSNNQLTVVKKDEASPAYPRPRLTAQAWPDELQPVSNYEPSGIDHWRGRDFNPPLPRPPLRFAHEYGVGNVVYEVTSNGNIPDLLVVVPNIEIDRSKSGFDAAKVAHLESDVASFAKRNGITKTIITHREIGM
jgi:hypothetical protein